eukprot:g26794.t1
MTTSTSQKYPSEEETSTQPYLGMATNVISMKRHSYDLYDTSVMQDSARERDRLFPLNPSNAPFANRHARNAAFVSE